MEPTKLLEDLKKFAETRSDEKASGKSGWITSLVMAVVGLIAFFIFAWVSNRNSKELARLRHEEIKHAIEISNAEVEAKAAINDATRLELEKLAKEIRDKADKVDKAIVEAKEAMKKDRVAIDSIKSWNDI